jgi:hypothetical protein
MLSGVTPSLRRSLKELKELYETLFYKGSERNVLKDIVCQKLSEDGNRISWLVSDERSLGREG